MPKEEQRKITEAVLKLQKKYNSDAFRYLYDTLSPKIYFICLRYLKNNAEAEDALHESFVIIYDKIKKFEGKGSFEGWAKKIAVRYCLHLLKKQKISIELKDNHAPFTEQKEFDSEKIKNKIKQNVNEALQQLPDGYRTVLNLSIIEGYSHQEIGKLLQIKEATSRSQLNRAKVALRKLISARK